MTKQEFIDELSAEVQMTKKQCGEVIDSLLEEIVNAADKDGKFVQPGFGIFRAAVSNERTGRNPADGKLYKYPKKRKMKFKVSSGLKEEING